MVGLNAGVFSKDLVDVALLGFLRTFVSGTLLFILLTRIAEYRTAIVKTLFASYKNLGITAGVSLALFGYRATIPAAICILFEIFFFNYLLFVTKKFKDALV